MSHEYVNFDEVLEPVDRWIEKATLSLLSMWDESGANFWRDSWRAEAERSRPTRPELEQQFGHGKGATSNSRAFQALVYAAYHFQDRGPLDRHADIISSVSDKVQLLVERYLSSDLAQLRDHGDNGTNPYTDSHLLLSFALALSPVTRRLCGLHRIADDRIAAVRQNLFDLAPQVANSVGELGVRLDPKTRPHPFLTMHAARALDAARRIIRHEDSRSTDADDLDLRTRDDHDALLQANREELVRQIGLARAPDPGFDASSLVSCCALLSRFTGDVDSPIVAEAVSALVEDQSDRGLWGGSGVISFQRSKLIWVPSVELSLALSSLTLQDLQEGDLDIFRRARPALDGSLSLIQSSFTSHRQSTGWGNDRTRSGNEVESWITAATLRFLLAYRWVLTVARQEETLRKYHADRNHGPLIEELTGDWGDLNYVIPHEQRLQMISSSRAATERIDVIRRASDPTDRGQIVEGIISDVLRPTLCNAVERPKQVSSVLFYGPPGTRKTSLAWLVAESLRWPIITLSPPRFLRSGIEGFEAAADEIFEDLAHVRRAVVLFDECEEFFRWRDPSTPISSRTVGAFITAGMLPRLQRLHDLKRVIFVIATNTERSELDDAVTRRGRLDKADRIGHPTLAAQLRYVRALLERDVRLRDALQERADIYTWFEVELAPIEATMRPLRDEAAQEREEAERKYPDRGPEFRSVMADIHGREARALTKVVTFAMLDHLVGRCIEGVVGGGVQTPRPIADQERLHENLEQEFLRFGPDKWSRVFVDEG